MNYKEDLEKGKIERSNLEANKKFLRKVDILVKNHKILEIGCGAGSMTAYLHSLGYDIKGIDPSEDLLDYAKKKHPQCKFLRMNGEKLSFKDNSFDVVLSFDVFEHITNSNKHLREVKRVLKKEGYYLLQTPNKLTNIPYSIIKDRSFTKWKEYHCSLQTEKSLKKLFVENGFSIKFVDMPVFNEFIKHKLKFPLNLINFEKFGIRTNIYGIGKCLN